MNLVRKKRRSNSGFSMAETLVAILIILLVSSVVAAGMPAAQRAYVNVQVSADAQLLLSTTLTELRNELAAASDVKLAVAETVEDEETITDADKSASGTYQGNYISFINPITGKCNIRLSGGNFVIERYQDINSTVISGTTTRPLVSDSAKTSSLSFDFGDASPFTYNPDNNTISIAAFSIKSKSGSEVARLEQPYVIGMLVPEST